MINIDEKTYVISDTHFFHANINKYCSRGYNIIDYNSVDELNRMNEDILSEFDKLPKNCTIWHLGDFAFMGRSREEELLNKKEELKNYVSRMSNNGTRKINIVLGNHDTLKFDGKRLLFYYSIGFDKVYDTPVIINDNIILCHEPVYVNKESNFKVIYGHTHDLDIKEDYFCYGFDNYAMETRTCKELGIPEPVLVNKYPEKTIDLSKYKNACYDKNKGFIYLNELL